MSVRIRVAEATVELDRVFELRHQVMVEEEGYMPARPDGRLADRFDAYPATANVVALVGERIVGALRFTERTPAGTSADEYFDFGPQLPPGARDVTASMLVLERAQRGTPRLVFALFGMGLLWAIERGATHVCSAVNPERRDGFLRSGWRTAGPEFRHGRSGLPVLPLVLDLAALQDRALEFLRHQRLEHWLRSFERQFHVAGETVLRRGERGDAVDVVADGRARVLGADGKPRDEIGPGELFGELALLTERPRTADVVAATDLDLMVLDRDSFRAQLRDDPRASERMLELLAERAAAALER